MIAWISGLLADVLGVFMLANQENRIARRSRILKDGKIVLLNNWSIVDCSIRDISGTGARIKCKNWTAVPNEFRLVVLSDNTIRDAKVVWRRDDQIGLEFTSEERKAPPRTW